MLRDQRGEYQQIAPKFSNTVQSAITQHSEFSNQHFSGLHNIIVQASRPARNGIATVTLRGRAQKR
jgi:hypothetical protein